VLVRFYKQGLETGIAAFFIVLFVYKLAEFERTWRERPVSSRDLFIPGTIGALVIFSRLDLVFLVALAGIWLVFRRNPIRYFMPLDIVSSAFSVLLAFVIKAGFPEYYELARPAVTMLAVSVLVKIPLAFLFGLYHRKTTRQTRPLFRSLALFVAASSAITGIAMMVLARLMSFDVFPRIVLV
jgi:multisubunit Na+/H+ antiporter MnhC subunit